MIFTVTERGSFKRCRRRWDYSSLNRQGLTSIMGSPNLALGLVIHKALETWMNELTDRETWRIQENAKPPGMFAFEMPPVHDLETLFMREAALEVANVRTRYHQNVGAWPSDVELSDLYEAIMLGKSMAANYESFYHTPIPEGFRLIKAEQQLIVKVPGTRHRLEAKLDLLLEHIATKKLYILDHKTYKARARDSSIQQNDQFLAYLWALAQVYPGRVGGFIYDGLWKRATPPKGGDMASLFHRVSSIRPQAELDEFGRHLADELREMGSPKTAIYPNRQWQGCWDCNFERLCATQSRGENYKMMRALEFTKRDEQQVALEDTELEEALA